MIISHDTFMLLGALFTGVVGGGWAFAVGIRLRREAMREDRAAAATGDKLFGSNITMLVGLVAMIGALKHYLH